MSGDVAELYGVTGSGGVKRQSKPRRPAGLGPDGAKLWSHIVGEFALEPHELLLLAEGCRQADRLQAIARALDGADLTVTNFRGDEVTNPLLVEARMLSQQFARTLASLRVPSGEQDDVPQRRGSARGTYAKA